MDLGIYLLQWLSAQLEVDVPFLVLDDPQAKVPVLVIVLSGIRRDVPNPGLLSPEQKCLCLFPQWLCPGLGWLCLFW